MKKGLPSFFPGPEPKPTPRRGGPGEKRKPRRTEAVSPCIKCPAERQVKVLPILPPRAKLVACGLAPGRVEVEELKPFRGDSGQLLQSALRHAKLKPDKDVGFINLARCRPIGDRFDTKDWDKMEKQCSAYLGIDLGIYQGPLLLLGDRVVQKFFKSKKMRVKNLRGLWHALPDGRQAFVTWHPAHIIRASGHEREELERQFVEDIRRMGEQVLGTEDRSGLDVEVMVFPDPGKAKKFLESLAKRPPYGRFFFDVESYDIAGVPARKTVATEPFHPDFRVRGVAIAIKPTVGAWIELRSWENKKEEARKLLAPAFESQYEKGAFYAAFDQDALIVPGWVNEIKNIVRDPWLASIALDMSGHRRSLDRMVVEFLSYPQPKKGVEIGSIASMSLEAVAEYAVRDACMAWQLDDEIQPMLKKGEYY